MKKVFILLCFLASSVPSLAIGFPVNNAYVHQRIEQSRSQGAGLRLVADERAVGVVAPLDREPVEIKPASTTFIEKASSWIFSLITRLISLI